MAMSSVNGLGESRGDSISVKKARAFLAKQALTCYVDPLSDGWSLKVARMNRRHRVARNRGHGVGTEKSIVKPSEIPKHVFGWFVRHGWEEVWAGERVRFHIRANGRRTRNQRPPPMDKMLDKWDADLAAMKMGETIRVERPGIAEVEL